MMLDRRQIFVGGSAAALTAALPASAFPATVQRFSAGEAVPAWIERPTHPGAFGVDVEVRIGSAELLTFAFDLPEGWGVLQIVPVAPMRPGSCLIRYAGASMWTFRSPPGAGFRGVLIFGDDPDALSWMEDGSDLLSSVAIEKGRTG